MHLQEGALFVIIQITSYWKWHQAKLAFLGSQEASPQWQHPPDNGLDFQPVSMVNHRTWADRPWALRKRSRLLLPIPASRIMQLGSWGHLSGKGCAQRP